MANCTVKMLRNPAVSLKCPLHEGETGELDQGLAEQLQRMNLAVIVAMPKSIKAVPSEPAIKADDAEAVPEPAPEPADEKAEEQTTRPRKAGK